MVGGPAHALKHKLGIGHAEAADFQAWLPGFGGSKMSRSLDVLEEQLGVEQGDLKVSEAGRTQLTGSEDEKTSPSDTCPC